MSVHQFHKKEFHICAKDSSCIEGGASYTEGGRSKTEGGGGFQKKKGGVPKRKGYPLPGTPSTPSGMPLPGFNRAD